MGKPGRPSKKAKEEAPKETPSWEDEEVKVSEPQDAPDTNESVPAQEIAASDCWRYHESEPPKIFKAGEVIPEGWMPNQQGFKRIWVSDDCGKFTLKSR